MSAVRLQFVLGAGLSSRLIAWWGQGYGGFSHVDAVMGDGWLLGARFDKVGGKPAGVQVRPPLYENWKYRRTLDMPCTALQQLKWTDYLHSQIGCQYDSADIWGFVIGREMKETGHWICSALQLSALQIAGILPHTEITPQQCPPNMLKAMLEAAGASVLKGSAPL